MLVTNKFSTAVGEAMYALGHMTGVPSNLPLLLCVPT